MAKFKVGDKVIGNAKANKYSVTVEGWIGTVTVVGHDVIWIKRSGEGCGVPVDPDCFDLFIETQPKKIVITTDGKTTTAALYDGKKRIKDAKAICSDSDTFDFMAGAKLAMERLSKPEKKPEKKGLNAILYIVEAIGSNFDEIQPGDVLKIIDGKIEDSELPLHGKIMNLDDLKYYFSPSFEADKLKHSDELGHFSVSGVKYKVMPLDDDEQ